MPELHRSRDPACDLAGGIAARAPPPVGIIYMHRGTLCAAPFQAGIFPSWTMKMPARFTGQINCPDSKAAAAAAAAWWHNR
jgi:hypothetical protein